VRTKPNPNIVEGLEFEGDGFVGGLRPIRGATALVIGQPPFVRPEAIGGLSVYFQNLSGEVNAPVIIFFTRPGAISRGPYLIEEGRDPVLISR
jgi:hypothetical protein